MPFSLPNDRMSEGSLESAGKDDAVFPKDHHLDALISYHFTVSISFIEKNYHLGYSNGQQQI